MVEELKGYSVEQLAAAAELPVSTIRMYQQRGLLAPPARTGRRVVYDASHLQRLRLIRDLQDRGYSLAAIGDLNDRLGSTGTLSSLLQLPDEQEQLQLSPAELAFRFEGTDLTAEDIHRAAALGLVTLNPEGTLTVRGAFLAAGSHLAQLGVPVRRILDEYERLNRQTQQIADQFAALYAEVFWNPPQTTAGPDLDVLNELGPLALTIVHDMLNAALRHAAATFAGEPGP